MRWRTTFIITLLVKSFCLILLATIILLTSRIPELTYATYDARSNKTHKVFGPFGPMRSERIEDKIRAASKRNGINTQVALSIAKCESQFDPNAKNPTSTASGVYQFTEGTWDWIGSSGSRFNADENIEAFMKWYPVYPTWWECHNKLYEI